MTTISEMISMSVDQAFNVVCAAHRTSNGQYEKYQSKAAIQSVLSGIIPIIDEDTQLAEKVLTYAKGLTFKLLEQNVSDYIKKVVSLVEQENISENEISIIAPLPAAYLRHNSKIQFNDRIQGVAQSYLGTIGNDISLTGEVIRCSWSQVYNIYFVTFVTDDNHLTFFSTGKKSFVNGQKLRIRGKVKAFRDNFQTQLNYVKCEQI